MHPRHRRDHGHRRHRGDHGNHRPEVRQRYRRRHLDRRGNHHRRRHRGHRGYPHLVRRDPDDQRRDVRNGSASHRGSDGEACCLGLDGDRQHRVLGARPHRQVRDDHRLPDGPVHPDDPADEVRPGPDADHPDPA